MNFVLAPSTLLRACLLAFLAFLAECWASPVVTLTREEWDATGAKTVAEALARTGKIHVVNAGGPGQRSVAWVHGATPSEITLLLNGLPIAEVSRAAPDLGQYRLEGLSKIEVTEGTSAAIPGLGARRIGINLISRLLVEEKGHVSGEGRGGTSGTYGVDFAAYLPSLLGVAGGYDQSERARPMTRWNGRHGMGTVEFTLAGGVAIQAAAMGINDTIGFVSPYFGVVDGARTRAVAGASAMWEMSETSRVMLGMSALTTQRRYDSAAGIATLGGLRQGAVQLALINQVNELDTVTVQASYYDALADEGFLGTPRWTWGELTIHNALQFRDIVEFIAELRADQHSLFGPYLSPTLDFIVNVGTSKIVLSVMNTVQFPTMDEVSMSPMTVSGTTWAGNVSLQPERTWTYRLGAEQRLNEDVLIGVELAGGGGESLIDHNWSVGSLAVRSPSNIATARMVGAGLNLGLKILEGLEYKGGYQFREWRSGASLLTDRPRQILTQSLVWTMDWGFTTTGWASYAQFPAAGVAPFPFAEADGAAAYSVNYGVSASWQFDRLARVTVGVDNPGGAGQFGLAGYEVASNHITGSLSLSW